MDQQTAVEQNSKEASLLEKKIHRRKFFKFSSVAVASAAFIASCDKDDDDGVNLGSGDTGVLNYAYALEQLESAFYTRVMSSPYTGITPTETIYLTDIRDGEISHREFFKNVLGGSAIPALEVDFSTVNFSSRDSVLNTAKMFEDTGVSAYNGAGKLLTVPANLVIAGKIVSVEARYAAILRDLLSNNSFAGSDVVDAMGLDKARMPNEVLSIVSPFVKTKINASNLPTS
jgi:hypothetical protein